MTLLEALIAMAIVAGVLASAVETVGLATSRSLVAEGDARASVLAQSLLVRAGEDLPFVAQEEVEREDGHVSWTVTGRPVGVSAKMELVEVTSRVKVRQDGIMIERTLSTLRLRERAAHAP